MGSFLGCAIKMLPFLMRMVSPQASSTACDRSDATLVVVLSVHLRQSSGTFDYILPTILSFPISK